jgi:FkbM family methyltransferase
MMVNFGHKFNNMLSSLLHRLPLTRIKIRIAGILYRIVSLFTRKKQRIIERNGITFEVDLTEGIDLSLFLFGNFQKHVTHNKQFSIKSDDVIIDVGANVGIMALQFAKMIPDGKVYAFEPTHYAWNKLQKNISLNPELAKRIVTTQSFVSSEDKESADIIAYASWKVGGAKSNELHPVHLGESKSTEGVGSVQLDSFVKQQNISRINFIKIDTDGHEFEVLKGARQTISAFKPAVIFEIGLYVMKEKGIDFDFYNDYFSSLGYTLYNSADMRSITMENYKKIIPEQGTIDILALPR